MLDLARLKYLAQFYFLPLIAAGLTFGFLVAEQLESQFVQGWDGYFYLVQLRAMLREGQQHSPDSSPIYWLLRGIYAFAQDEMLAYKILCAGLAGSYSFILCAWTKQLSKSNWLTLLIGIWLVFSPSLRFFAPQFPKNLAGINALLLFLWASYSRKTKFTVFAFGLTFIFHRMTAGLSMLFLGLRALTWKRIYWAIGILGMAILLGQIFPGIIHFSDFSRFEGSFQERPHFPGSTLLQSFDGIQNTNAWRFEIILAPILVLLFLVQFLRNRKTFGQSNWATGLIGLLCFLAFPFWSEEARGMGDRFFLAFLLLSPICLVRLIRYWQKAFLIPLIILALVFGISNALHFPHQAFSADYDSYSQLKKPLLTRFQQHPPSLLIGHKALAEYITFETGYDVLPWQPEYELDTANTFRIVRGIFPMEFRYYLNNQDHSFVEELSISYHLVREDVWQRFVAAVETENEDSELLGRIYSWENPFEQRPSYLRRGKRMN